jgi:AraC-like DNA-binding protein
VTRRPALPASPRLNAYSLLLLLGAANGFVLGALLWLSRANRGANRLLAALVALVALRLLPYVLGYAGAYDAHRWLTFAPFDLSLAFGPLLWGYVAALTAGERPRGWSWHLAPAAAQLAYSLACFALPADAKWSWYTGPHLHAVAPAGLAAALLSLAAYLRAAWRRYAAYQAWLAANLSNREELRLGWLRGVLLAFGATVVVGAGFALTSWLVVPLDYFDRFPQMVWLAGLVYFLGLVGWRHGERAYPHPAPDEAVPAAADTDPEPAPPLADDAPPPAVRSGTTATATAALAARWAARVAEAGWWRDEELTLAALARHLGTSPRTLSRALNEGLGQSFNEFVNRMRVDAVAAELRDPARRRDLLAVALDAGFSSKASFNRAFRAYTGTTPSEFRRRAEAERLNARQCAPPAESATRGGAG